ncbi:MAG: hypothetical protein R3Y30_21250, partial [Vibrio sp.]
MLSIVVFKYAQFRHRNKILGRLIQLSIISLFMGSILMMCLTNSFTVIIYSAIVTLAVFFKIVVIICLVIKQLLFLDLNEPHQLV